MLCLDQCTSGFINDGDQLKVTCLSCRNSFCAQCKKPVSIITVCDHFSSSWAWIENNELLSPSLASVGASAPGPVLWAVPAVEEGERPGVPEAGPGRLPERQRHQWDSLYLIKPVYQCHDVIAFPLLYISEPHPPFCLVIVVSGLTYFFRDQCVCLPIWQDSTTAKDLFYSLFYFLYHSDLNYLFPSKENTSLVKTASNLSVCA